MIHEMLGETLGRALVAYVALILYIRISGARTLAKMHAFDFVVTIALGSLLAAVVVSPATSLWQGLLAMALLILFQWIVSRTTNASSAFGRLIRNPSIKLYAEGAFDEDAMRKARITRHEIDSALREAGHEDISHVRAVWLESNGSLSVVDRP